MFPGLPEREAECFLRCRVTLKSPTPATIAASRANLSGFRGGQLDLFLTTATPSLASCLRLFVSRACNRVVRVLPPDARDSVLRGVESIVIDEVDRLVDVVPKHAPSQEVRKRQKHARPIASLLEMVLVSAPNVQVRAAVPANGSGTSLGLADARDEGRGHSPTTSRRRP